MDHDERTRTATHSHAQPGSRPAHPPQRRDARAAARGEGGLPEGCSHHLRPAAACSGLTIRARAQYKAPLAPGARLRCACPLFLSRGATPGSPRAPLSPSAALSGGTPQIPSKFTAASRPALPRLPAATNSPPGMASLTRCTLLLFILSFKHSSPALGRRLVGDLVRFKVRGRRLGRPIRRCWAPGGEFLSLGLLVGVSWVKAISVS